VRASDRRWLPPLLAVLPFLPLLTAPRMVDERVLAFEAIKWIGLDPVAPWALPVGGSGTWRPMLVYLFRLDANAPVWVAHGVNLALHAGAATLLHAWLRRRLAPSAALVGACFFAVHPAHVATAGWIGGRADGAMVVFGLLAMLWLPKRPLLAALAVGVAILFKETGVALLPMLALLAWQDGRLRSAAPALAVGAIVFGVSLWLAGVDPSYVPGRGWLAMVTRWAAPTGLEVVAPFFVPLGVPTVPRDVVGIAAAMVAGALLLQWGASRPGVRTGLGLVVLAMLPVLHVLPNDGGQWYLLLPSVGAALAWGALAEDRPRIPMAVVILAAGLALFESMAWREAAQRVDATIEAQRMVDPRVEPPRQDPRAWPHRGPSFCCGLPHQLFDDPLPDAPPGAETP
jgi:hypothetical protein